MILKKKKRKWINDMSCQHESSTKNKTNCKQKKITYIFVTHEQHRPSVLHTEIKCALNEKNTYILL